MEQKKCHIMKISIKCNIIHKDFAVHRDCERYFGKESLQPISRDDSVICSIEYSKIVPLEGGEVSFLSLAFSYTYILCR